MVYGVRLVSDPALFACPDKVVIFNYNLLNYWSRITFLCHELNQLSFFDICDGYKILNSIIQFNVSLKYKIEYKSPILAVGWYNNNGCQVANIEIMCKYLTKDMSEPVLGWTNSLGISIFYTP